MNTTGPPITNDGATAGSDRVNTLVKKYLYLVIAKIELP